MKNYILIIAVLCLSACRTRQVSIGKTNITDRSVKTELLKSGLQHTDTTQTITHLLSKDQNKDSVEIAIIPDTGIIKIINGNYIGKARNIVIKHRSSSAQTVSSLIQQKKGEITLATLSDSTVQKNNIRIQVKNKQTTTKGISMVWFLIAGTLLAALLIITRIKHYL